LRPRDFLVRLGTGTGIGAHGLSEPLRLRGEMVRKVPLTWFTSLCLLMVPYGWWRMFRFDSVLGLGLGR